MAAAAVGEADGVAVGSAVPVAGDVSVPLAVGCEVAPPVEPPQAASRAAPATMTTAAAITSRGSRRPMPAAARRVIGHLGSEWTGVEPSTRRRRVLPVRVRAGPPAGVPAGRARLALPMPTDPTKARYYRKQVPLFRLVEKLKLWPSRRGILHGIKEFEERGSYAVVVTHCNKRMVVHDSKTSRAARWLRNKWYAEACPQCRIPEWKLQKYASTQFKRGYGSHLRDL